MIRKAPAVFLVVLFLLVSISCANPITDYFSTQTAVRETATAAMWTPTPTCTSTQTPTDTPTDTPAFTPTPDFLYADDFSDPDSGWAVGETDYMLYEYSEGGYRVKVMTPLFIAWSMSPAER